MVILRTSRDSFILGRLLFVDSFRFHLWASYVTLCVHGPGGDASGNHLYLSPNPGVFDCGHREAAMLARFIRTEIQCGGRVKDHQ